MNTIMIEILFVICLVAGGAWAMHHHDAKQIDGLKADNASLVQAQERVVAQGKIDGATVASLAQTKAVQARSNALVARRLSAATASSPTWAQTAVPQEVQDALR